MIISMIVAYGKNREIGLDNKMLWHISEDFKNFKTITSGHHILMGRKTFQSIGKPLPNRTSIVLSNSGFTFDGVHTFNDIQKAIDFAKDSGEKELFVIGGANVYESLFPYINKMYLSEVNYEGKADAHLKELDLSTWNLNEEKYYEEILDTRGDITSPSWTFKIYNKKA
ncbi:MAG: dihydrofolate reductase [Campylobacteraceae bacterium]|nr:dihydrofolate reductase [Campylobacteraceae bacterium]